MSEMTFQQMREFVFQHCTCGKCKLWNPDTLNCSAHTDDIETEGSLKVCESFGCIYWQPKSEPDECAYDYE